MTFNLGLLVLLLTLLEVGARIFVARDIRSVFNAPQMFIRGRPFVVPDSRRGFALKAGYSAPGNQINSAGFRGPELPENLQDHMRIVSMGASSTFGWGVQDHETYPAVLQGLLSTMPSGTATSVINAGIPSYTSAQVQIYLGEIFETLHPQIVILSVIWNDALYSTVDNWFPELLLIQKPARWRQFLLQHSGLYRAAFIRMDAKSPLPERVNREALKHYGANLRRIAEECRRNGARLLVLHPSLHPDHIPAEGLRVGPRTIPKDLFLKIMVEFTAELERVADELNLPVIRHRLSSGENVSDEHFLDPAHPSATGYVFIAEDVKAALFELGVFQHEVLSGPP